MKKNWFAYYKNHHGIHFSNILLHWPYLLRLITLQPKKVLEIGCGTADHSIFLSYIILHLKISLLDYESQIIDNLKKKLTSKIDNYYLCDLTNKNEVKRQLNHNRYDFIYSQGLMEHFSKAQFRNIIINLIPFTKKFVFSIPSEQYPNKDFGNEILRDKKRIESILKLTNNIKFSITPYFPDIGIRTKILTVKKRKYNFFESVHFLLFGSCHYLIEICVIS